jgi:hypothetical protein
MERGDLALSVRPKYVLVLEGVLAHITPIVVERKMRSDRHVGWNISWHDVPLRRLATMTRRFPDVNAEIVTFISEAMADTAGEYLDLINIGYSAIAYHPFEQFCQLLSFQEDLQAVYDSDPNRLDRYGQLGNAVIRGEDW